MRTLLTIAVLLGLLLILAGSACLVGLLPTWGVFLVCPMVGWNVWACLDTVGEIWAAKA